MTPMHYPPEPFRIKVIESIRLIPPAESEKPRSKRQAITSSPSRPKTSSSTC